MKKDFTGILLFLDDYRIPERVHPLHFLESFKAVSICRTYDEFVEHIEDIGMPSHISFDHDLADEHYVDPEEFETYNDYLKAVSSEKTGYHACLWIIEYCIDNDQRLPSFSCHSQNPVGKDKILSSLRKFRDFQDEKLIKESDNEKV